jgi:hypothetical protein
MKDSVINARKNVSKIEKYRWLTQIMAELPIEKIVLVYSI